MSGSGTTLPVTPATAVQTSFPLGMPRAGQLGNEPVQVLAIHTAEGTMS